MRAHFWIPEPAPDVDGWDPDSAPEAYSTGIGHNLYELYARLRSAGEAVTLGPDQPDRGVVVVYAKSLRPLTAQLALLRGLGSKPLIVIRSDTDPGWHPRLTADVEVMPYASAVSSASHVWVPALPQRGMIRRSAGRFGRIRTVGFKGNPANLPSFMHGPRWVLALEDMGLRWLRDTPEHVDGSDQSWHDFSEVDVAVCLRAEHWGRHSWKPATKLINAWCAGVIPLVGPEQGYLDLVTPNEDAFLVANECDVVAVLKRLTADSDLVRATERAIGKRASEFAMDTVLDQWRALLHRTSETPIGTDALRKRRRDARRLSALTRLNKLRRNHRGRRRFARQGVLRKADE
jgi:hypothetical protein